jgi:hypothetical protein
MSLIMTHMSYVSYHDTHESCLLYWHTWVMSLIMTHMSHVSYIWHTWVMSLTHCGAQLEQRQGGMGGSHGSLWARLHAGVDQGGLNCGAGVIKCQKRPIHTKRDPIIYQKRPAKLRWHRGWCGCNFSKITSWSMQTVVSSHVVGHVSRESCVSWVLSLVSHVSRESCLSWVMSLMSPVSRESCLSWVMSLMSSVFYIWHKLKHADGCV